jgi:hypothetical protein
MELLGKRESYQEAFEYYEKLRHVLKEDGQQPDPHTQDVVEYLRAKRIQRTSQSSTHAQEVERIADRKNAIIQQTVLGGGSDSFFIFSRHLFTFPRGKTYGIFRFIPPVVIATPFRSHWFCRLTFRLGRCARTHPFTVNTSQNA